MKEETYGYSLDEENFSGNYPSRAEAWAAAVREIRVPCKVWTGVYRRPSSPENYLDADLVIEHVQCQEDYFHAFSEDWPIANRATLDELTKELREVLAKWLDRHDLRPTFVVVEDVRELYVDPAAEAAQ